MQLNACRGSNVANSRVGIKPRCDKPRKQNKHDRLPPNLSSLPYCHCPRASCSPTTNAEITIASRGTPASTNTLSKKIKKKKSSNFYFLLINGLIKPNGWGNILWDHSVVRITGSVIFLGVDTSRCVWACTGRRGDEEAWHRFPVKGSILRSS